MRWIKKGQIFLPKGNYSWNKSHAQVPVGQITEYESIRIFYSTRDINNRSVISYIEVDAENPNKILRIKDSPILDLGKPGTFDDSGMMPTSIIELNNKTYLYYIGWNTRLLVPYHNSIGLAVSNDKCNSFTRFSEGPIIERTYIEPYFSGTANIIKESDKWKMWYLSCFKWEMVGKKQEPFYHIKYAESSNGIDWIRNGTIVIELKENEGGIASVNVLKINSLFHMWYCYRGIMDYRTESLNSYKIGYANSQDGINWQRKDKEAGISLSEVGWDSKMMAYPNIIQFKSKYYMFYNGNGFGKTGIGYAILEV